METLSKESLSLLESLIQTGSSSFGDGIAERITDYLEQNLEQNVSLDMLAQSMNYSAAYLSRLIKNKTVLIIAHRMRTVAGADKVVVLKDGIVAEQGRPDELYARNGLYAHMVDLQSASQNWTI